MSPPPPGGYKPIRVLPKLLEAALYTRNIILPKLKKFNY